jgi:hypothetical protein
MVAEKIFSMKITMRNPDASGQRPDASFQVALVRNNLRCPGWKRLVCRTGKSGERMLVNKAYWKALELMKECL